MDPKVIAGIGMEITNGLALLSASPATYNAFAANESRVMLEWERFNNAEEPFDVILVFPEDKLVAERALLCVMVNQLIETLMRRSLRRYDSAELPPVLVMLDEFPRFGRMPVLKDGLTTLRSRGVTMVLLLQSIASLNEIYGEQAARVILENCTYKAVLNAPLWLFTITMPIPKDAKISRPLMLSGKTPMPIW